MFSSTRAYKTTLTATQISKNNAIFPLSKLYPVVNFFIFLSAYIIVKRSRHTRELTPYRIVRIVVKAVAVIQSCSNFQGKGNCCWQLNISYLDSWYTDKKENHIFLIYRKILSGAVAKSYMINGLLIYGEKYFRISSYIRKPFLIFDFATAPLWISLYKRKILFSFLSV